jgi:glutamyl-tRNA synthetase
MSDIITRFAPSPTGYLHIGGARTALINYLFTKKHNGKFLLRIEDTDYNRSDTKCIDAILESLSWLNIQNDGDIVYQSQNLKRHVDVAMDLLSSGLAYYCNCTSGRLDSLRKYQAQNKITQMYDKHCRCKNLNNGCIRLKVPSTDSQIILDDMIKGPVYVSTNTMDDMVLLRTDGTPTYLLSSVVDDHDMGITHIIRGDDHLTNAFRQILIFKACNWKIPKYAHIPLIFGDDGTKLSKRHGAVGVHNYIDLGYLPDAMVLYLYSLGFNFNIKDTLDDIIKKFNIKKMSKSNSQINLHILNKINQKCMDQLDDNLLIKFLYPNCTNNNLFQIIKRAKKDIIQRSKTLCDARQLISNVYLSNVDKSIIKQNVDDHTIQFIYKFISIMDDCIFNDYDTIKDYIVKICNDKSADVVTILNGLRWVLTGQQNSPNVANIMFALGYDLVKEKISVCIN